MNKQMCVYFARDFYNNVRKQGNKNKGVKDPPGYEKTQWCILL